LPTIRSHEKACPTQEFERTHSCLNYQILRKYIKSQKQNKMENDEPQPPLAAFVIEPIDISTNRDRILGSTNKRRPPKLGRSRDPPSSARCAARSVAPPPGSASKPPLPGCRSRASSRCSWDPRRQALTHQSRRYRDAGAVRTRCSAPPLLGI